MVLGEDDIKSFDGVNGLDVFTVMIKYRYV